jgi:hypothetical protein
VSQLSTYLAGALAVVLMIDHAPSLGILPPASGWAVWPGEIAEPMTIDRARKGDRLVPEPARRDARPAEAPLDVVELLTGSVGERRSAPAPAPSNVTVLIKREPPLGDPQRPALALPLGCESAFGRLAAPPLAQVPGRCIL